MDMKTEEEVAPVENIEKKSWIVKTKQKKKQYPVSKFVIDTICMASESQH